MEKKNNKNKKKTTEIWSWTTFFWTTKGTFASPISACANCKSISTEPPTPSAAHPITWRQKYGPSPWKHDPPFIGH